LILVNHHVEIVYLYFPRHINQGDFLKKTSFSENEQNDIVKSCKLDADDVIFKILPNYDDKSEASRDLMTIRLRQMFLSVVKLHYWEYFEVS
jgi:adenylate kinase family enzyme